MSETSMILCSQGPLSGNDSLDSHGNTIIAKGLSQLREDSKLKPRFAEFTCSYTEVSTKNVTARILLMTCLGILLRDGYHQSCHSIRNVGMPEEL